MKYTHNNDTYDNQLEFYEDRLKTVDLLWCNQILNLIKPENKIIKLNDIGCNYFQFFKEIKRMQRETYFDYFGYDIDSNFINLGLKYFPQLNKKYSIQNIENYLPRKADVSIISATLEHCEYPHKLLNNIFQI